MKKIKYDKVIIKKSTNPKKKLMAVFTRDDGSSKKTTHFGASGYSDFPTHKDLKRKQLYLGRHIKREQWSSPTTAGALSRWILWNKLTRQASISDYKRRFGFK